MIVFAHLRKCAGTSVVRAALDAGLVLPPGHVNGHPPGSDGHALAGLSSMSPEAIGNIVKRLTASGVQFMALEWDFPPIARFADAEPLAFFTIFRDPVERFLSNYAYDISYRFTSSRSLWDYIRGTGIWQRDNYYTRFFCGLSASDAVTDRHVVDAADVIASRFRWACVGDDLLEFLRDDVGLPIRTLGRHNHTNGILKLLNRSRLGVSESDLAELRRLNDADYALLATLDSRRRARSRTPTSACL